MAKRGLWARASCAEDGASGPTASRWGPSAGGDLGGVGWEPTRPTATSQPEKRVAITRSAGLGSERSRSGWGDSAESGGLGNESGRFGVTGRFGVRFGGEFDPGSGSTLAACLMHASRARALSGVLRGGRVRNTWATCPGVGDSRGKPRVIPHTLLLQSGGARKTLRRRPRRGLRPISWTVGSRPTVAMIGSWSERTASHTGTETRPRLLREAAARNLPQWGQP